MATSRKNRIPIIAAAALTVAALIAVGPTSASAEADSAPDARAAAAKQVIEGRYLVVYEDSAGPVNTATAQLEEQLGFESALRYRHAVDGFAAELRPAQVRALERDPDVAFVAEDRRVSTSAEVPIVPGDNAPAGVRRVLAATATTVREASGAAVAVIDTGVQLDHPDLNVAAGTDCVDPGTPASDGHGHGTHVAGTIAARNNGSGVVGIAPGTVIHPVRVLGDDGKGSWSNVVCGVDWVTANAESLGIGVANMSLGGPGSRVDACETTSDPMHLAICASTDAGLSYVVAAGNAGRAFDSADKPDVPAVYPEALTVTAIADSDGLPGGVGGPRCGQGDDLAASFSNFAATPAGFEHTIAAPGTCIRSTYPGGRYTTMSGTSMAAPHIAGLVALCLDEAGASGPCAGMASAELIGWLRAEAESYTTADESYGFRHDPLHDPIGCPAPQHYGFLTVMPASGPPPASLSPTPAASCEAQESESPASDEPDPVSGDPAPPREQEPAPPPEPEPVPEEGADRAPLEVMITAAPRKIRLPARRSRARVKFRFTASADDARFRCSIDRRRFQRCSSAFRSRVKAGRHKFRLKVKAGDERAKSAKKFKIRRAKR